MRIRVATIGCVAAFVMTTSCETRDTRNESPEKVIVSGERVKFAYDNDDRVIAITGPGTRKVELNYDERGRLHTVRNREGVVRYDYNSLNLLTRLEDNTGTSRFEYDSHGRLAKMTYPQGDEIVYKYTQAGDIASVSWGDKHYLRYERDLFGNIVAMDTPVGQFRFYYDYNKRIIQRSYPNGAFSQFTYGENGRPVHVQHATPDGNLALEFKYAYDDAGLLKTAREWRRNSEVEINYSYDAYGQLLRAEYSDGRVYSYEYDMFGNCVRWSGPSGVSTATYNQHDQMTTLNGQPVTHDAAGNVTFLDSTEYVYDDSDELINDGHNRYQYNALGLRVGSKTPDRTTRFLHLMDDLPYVLAETGEVAKRYLWADGLILGQTDGNGGLFFLEDHLGSVRGAVDQSGQLIGHGEFSPFGEPISRIVDVRFGFAGQEQDHVGNLYLRARYYQPRIGRFLSSDPVIVDLMGKEKQNLYTYAVNSPSNYSDLDGTQAQKLAQYLSADRRPYTPTFNEVLEYLRFMEQNADFDLVHLSQIIAEETEIWPDNWDVQQVYVPGYGLADMNYLVAARYLPIPGLKGLNLLGWRAISQLAYSAVKAPLDYMKFRVEIARKKRRPDNSLFGDLKLAISWKDMLTAIRMVGADDFADYRGWNLGLMMNVGNLVDMINGNTSWRQNPKNTGSWSSFAGQWQYRKLKDLWSQIHPEHSGDSAGDPPGDESKVFQETKALTDRIMAQMSTVYSILAQYDVSAGAGRVAGPGGYASSEAYAALDAFRRAQHSRPPNVGGVYLDRAAEVIGQLGAIDGAVYDPVSNRIILIGQGADRLSLPVLRLGDLAAAYRTVFGNYSREPGVTIDPDSLNPYAESMNVVFFGGMENTRLGHMLFEADRIMKSLSLGQDNITHHKMGAGVSGYYNLLDLGFSNLGGTYNKGLWSRFWLVPERVTVKVSDDKRSISFPDTRIRVKTETMLWQKGHLVPAKGVVDEKAEYFAAHFTKHYDKYAREYPVYEELKNLANLVGIMKWLKESTAPVDLAWLEKYEEKYDTPEKTPSLSVSASRKTQGQTVQTISIFGGTDLTVNNRYVIDDGVSQDYGKKALLAVVGIQGVALGEFTGSDGRQKKALALPTSQTRAPGAKMIETYELGLITRAYCSFHNARGPFGYSWIVDLPRLRITQRHRGRSEFITVGMQNVLIQDFRLIRPFGLQDVRFKEATVDQQTGRIVFLPEKQSGIKGLYPEGGEYHVEYFDGRIERFDSRGYIKRSDVTPILRLKYLYDAQVRLESVELVEKDEVISKVELRYDTHGRVVTADVDQEHIRYDYDASGNLIRVSGGKDIIEYSYDERHLVTGVRSGGQASVAIEYDEFGRVRAQRTRDSELSVDIRTGVKEAVVIQGSGNQKTIRRYDAGGRLLEVRFDSGVSIRNGYHEIGSLASREYTDQFGDKVTFEYSPNGRFTKYTNSEGHVLALLLDEFGRLRQIQNETNALLSKQYGQTPDGWLETTETSELQVQLVHNKMLKPVKRIITAKSQFGGQLVTDLFYTKKGVVRQTVTRGLVDVIRVFENGRLAQENSGDRKSWFFYDGEGRLNILTSSAGKIKVSYDSHGLIAKIESRRGAFREANHFQHGQLTRRSSSLGLTDTFQYHENGMLKMLKRVDGEAWVVVREDNRTRYIRNNVVQVEFVWDGKGRLLELLY